MAKYNNKEDKEKKPRISQLSPQTIDKMKDRILEIIVIQKKYKDKDYTENQLAKDLGTNRYYTSVTINTKFHCTYRNFVNRLRIEDACDILVDKRYKDLKMYEVSRMVGFANRISFYAAFNKFMHITPKEYKIAHTA